MKFKNVFGITIRDVTLESYKVLPKNTKIEPDQIIEVNDPIMIKRMQAGANGIYEEVKDTSAPIMPKIPEIPIGGV
ncbi:MAG: hypothetical protein K8E24_014330 [Methanobacterium paludis]|nr:hypothetical protein [Methanobacterium paludis]